MAIEGRSLTEDKKRMRKYYNKEISYKDMREQLVKKHTLKRGKIWTLVMIIGMNRIANIVIQINICKFYMKGTYISYIQKAAYNGTIFFLSVNPKFFVESFIT